MVDEKEKGEESCNASETTARSALEVSARLFTTAVKNRAPGPPAFRYLLTSARGARCEEMARMCIQTHACAYKTLFYILADLLLGFFFFNL